MFAKVIVDIASSLVDKVFDYHFDDADNYQKGMRVLVPFANRVMEGYIIDITDAPMYDPSKIKDIIRPLENFACILPDQLKIADFMKEKYNIGMCDALRLFLPAEMRSGKVKELEEIELYLEDKDKAINYMASLRKNSHAQENAILFMLENGSYLQAELNKKFGASAINKLKENDILKSRVKVKRRKPYATDNLVAANKVTLVDAQQKAKEQILSKSYTYLLHGVTGSGKTEVYMSTIEDVIAKGKTAIMLVPEISLTPQVLGNFRSRFGDNVALLHSGLSAGERFDEWKRILMGDAKIVVGARSAIFAPLKNIGLIVIDEEHDGSYISESNPRYNTIEVAIMRSKLADCSLVLGSATPDIESYHKAMIGTYELIEMKHRINKRDLPPIQIIDMCKEIKDGNPGIFSRALIDALDKTIKEGNQAMLFINRRGFSSFLMCKECGWVAKCESCDVSLVYHKFDNALKCHYCDKRYRVFDVCPECGSDNIKQGSVGTEKVVQELNELFPDVKVLRMDNDTTKTKGAHAKLLAEFREKKAQILVGTQMIAKGHDFPSVTLVGIVDADVSLHQSSFKAPERTFNLITQVAGRAGRADKAGEIYLQSYASRNYIYRLASKYDYTSFYRKEINLREVTSYPPFSKIIRLLFTSFNEDLAKEHTKVYYDRMKELASEFMGEFIYLGVMKSPVGRIQDKFRYQILMRLKPQNADQIISKIYEQVNTVKNRDVSVFVEIDPASLS
ncbi:MAG: primosomal protein N' [Clostridia bacterium]|nr:primosomal protein N' [Clostridia bacterium]